MGSLRAISHFAAVFAFILIHVVAKPSAQDLQRLIGNIPEIREELTELEHQAEVTQANPDAGRIKALNDAYTRVLWRFHGTRRLIELEEAHEQTYQHVLMSLGKPYDEAALSAESHVQNELDDLYNKLMNIARVMNRTKRDLENNENIKRENDVISTELKQATDVSRNGVSVH